jgi:hypothetical protein
VLRSVMVRSLAWILTATVLTGILGFSLGPVFFPQQADWQDSLRAMGVGDHTAFEQVAGIHVGAYVGALVSWLIAMIVVKWGRIGPRTPATNPKSPLSNDADPP